MCSRRHIPAVPFNTQPSQSPRHLYPQCTDVVAVHIDGQESQRHSRRVVVDQRRVEPHTLDGQCVEQLRAV